VGAVGFMADGFFVGMERTRNMLIVGSLGWLLTGGCAVSVPAECGGRAGGVGDMGSGGVAFGDFDALPRARVGCLPFPGAFTLYSPATVDGLGEHSYDDGNSETSRGIVYTVRGGFLDIAHIRNTADMTAYIHARVSHAVRAGWGCVRFRGHEPCVYTVRLEYPVWWAGLSARERAEVGEEYALRLSQRLAVQVMTWHEILTWYGYKSTGLVSEEGSAFTYEDGPSHVVGALIAGEALRAARNGEDFDAQVTVLLAQTLEELGAVGKEGLSEAVSAVEGDWWAGGAALRRHVATGLDGPLTAWLAPGLSFDDGSGPQLWALPDLGDVMGHDCAGLAAVRIDPKVFEKGRVLRLLAETDDLVCPDRDFPVLIADIRSEVGEAMTRVETRAGTETAARE
jgi:hypothetical protein